MQNSIKSAVIYFLKVILPLGLGVFILWLVYRKMDFAAIMHVLRSNVNFWVIASSLIFGLLANIVRAYRWNLLFKPLGENPQMHNLIYAVLGNYVVNLVLPRLGEVWRCGMIAKYEKISFPKLFGTLLVDRLADTLTVGLIVLAVIPLNIPFFKGYLSRNPEIFEKFNHFISSPWLYAGIFLFIAILWATFKFLGHIKIMVRLKYFLNNIWEGIKTVWYMKDKWKFLFYTFLIWFGYFLYFYICFFAFDFTKDLGWVAGLIAFGLSSVAVAVPVQGGIGAWHAAVIASLINFGVLENNAAAFALIVHTIQTVFTALAGLFGVIALPIVNRSKNEIAVEEMV